MRRAQSSPKNYKEKERTKKNLISNRERSKEQG